jgi:hypothetical protein
MPPHLHTHLTPVSSWVSSCAPEPHRGGDDPSVEGRHQAVDDLSSLHCAIKQAVCIAPPAAAPVPPQRKPRWRAGAARGAARKSPGGRGAGDGGCWGGHGRRGGAKSALNFLLCCRCCQALLPMFFFPAFSGRWVTSPRLVWRLPVAPRPRISNDLPPVRIWTRSIGVEISPLQRCQRQPETYEVKACECTSFA